MSESIRILLVEDNPADAQLLREFLAEVENTDFELVRVERLGDALQRLGNERFDVMLLDLSLPDAQGLETVTRAYKQGAPIVVLTGLDDKTLAINALRAGAQDYLVKGQIAAPLLERSIRYAIERHRSEEMIEHYAYYDRLTDLPNRNLLYDRLQQAILAAHRENKLAALLIADVDRFKEINGAVGHQFGDQLLHQIGPRLKATLRESDTVARLGGDEFAMLLPSVADAGAAIEVASKVLKALEDPFLIAGLNIQIEASIGIALFPEHGIDADTLFKRADVAMYMAKETRNGYALYSAENDPNSSHRVTLMGELRRAIIEDQLFLLYQPKIDLKTGRVRGVEALVRWRHPQAGIRMPDNFIPLAERTGLITPLTVWVLDKALRQCHAWHQEGLTLGMAVNLSRRNLQAQKLPDQIAGMLEANGVSPADLELEITESSIMANPVRAMEVLSRMTSMGLQFSLDDFGTGHSSLAYLKKLPVNEIKIDKSFVTKMVAQAEDVAIIRSIIDLGHILGLKVVAEGVEDRVTLDKLIALGCDMAQGYFICRPISAEELTRWLRSQPDPLNGDNGHVQRNLNPEH